MCSRPSRAVGAGAGPRGRHGRVPRRRAAAGPVGVGGAGAVPGLPGPARRRTPAGGCATGTTCAGITASAASGSRPASRSGWPGRSRSTGTAPAGWPSARTWRPRRSGLCSGHDSRYQRQGRPGGAALPPSWSRNYEARGLPVPVSCRDEEEFRAWCAAQPPVPWPGQIILAGLAPLPAAEIRWGLFAHTQRERHTRWDAGWVQALVNTCRARGAAPDRA